MDKDVLRRCAFLSCGERDRLSERISPYIVAPCRQRLSAFPADISVKLSLKIEPMR